MNLARIALANREATITLMFICLLGGLFVFNNYPSREDPYVTSIVATITAQLPGASAEQIERLVAVPIEERLREIPEVDEVRSFLRANSAYIEVWLHDDTLDADPIWTKVRAKLEQTAESLPKEIVGPYFHDDYSDVTIANIVLTGENWELSELHDQARHLRNQFYKVPGVAKVTLHGAIEEQVFIEAFSGIAQETGVDLRQLTAAIQDQNTLLPSGVTYTDTREILIGTSGKLASVESISDIYVPGADRSATFPLQELMQIEKGYADPPREQAFYNGKPAVVLGVVMQKGHNILELGPKLKEAINYAKASLPVGMTLETSTFQADVVNNAINSVKSSLYQTLVVVLLVVMLVLGFREGLIVGLTVPLTMLTTFILMRWMAVDLQFISLMALMVSLGMLVDNGIVVTENINLRMAAGDSPDEASINASRTLALPLLTSTLTTVFAFAPILVPDNINAQYMRSLSQVVCTALLVSWFVSLIAVPVLNSWFYRNKSTDALTKTSAPKSQKKPFFLNGAYANVLRRMLRLPIWSLIGLSVIAIGCVFSLGNMKSQNLPLSTRSEILVDIILPAGYHIKSTNEVVKQLETYLLDKDENPGVLSTSAYTGSSGPRFFLTLEPIKPASNKAFMLVNTLDSPSANNIRDKLEKWVNANIITADVRARIISRGSIPPRLTGLRIYGPDAQTLYTLAKNLQNALDDIPGIRYTTNDWENPIRRMLLDIDRASAARAGVDYEDISNALQSFFSGSRVTEIREGDKLIPIIARGNDALRLHPDNLEQVLVYSSTTEQTVSLSQIARVDDIAELCCINRRNLERVITIEGLHNSYMAPETQAAWNEKAKDILENLPPGYRIEQGGEIEQMTSTYGALLEAYPIFIGLIIFVLIAQFHSWTKPIIILLTIPYAFILGMTGVVIVGVYMDFPAMLGLLALSGIIINNGIVLIDKIDVERSNYSDIREAILTACINRLRPVMITTFTTILGLVPLLLMDESMFYGFSILVMTGLAAGTVVTLGLVPVLYMLWCKKAPQHNVAAN